MSLAVRLLAFVLIALCGCVPAAPARTTRTEAMHGPPPPPSRQRTACGELAAGPHQDAEPAPPPDPSGKKVWVRGYWHWDGVRYAWVKGHWEPAKPGFAWHR